MRGRLYFFRIPQSRPSHPNHGEGVYIIRNLLRYIIKAVRFVYHQAAGEYTLTRDEIQPEGLMICTALRAAMICQACDLDKKIPKAFAFGIFWRRHPDLNWGIEVLQTFALPLGYDAV